MGPERDRWGLERARYLDRGWTGLHGGGAGAGEGIMATLERARYGLKRVRLCLEKARCYTR